MTQEAKHTKGPWFEGWGDGLTGPTTPVQQPVCGGKEWPYTVVSKGRRTIAVVPAQADAVGNPCKESMEQHARLIAASPDMYEALEIFEKALNAKAATWYPEPFAEKLRAALAKARGE